MATLTPSRGRESHEAQRRQPGFWHRLVRMKADCRRSGGLETWTTQLVTELVSSGALMRGVSREIQGDSLVEGTGRNAVTVRSGRWMFPVCVVGARAQGLGSRSRSRMLCHSLARVVKQHFWLELAPCCVPQDYYQISVETVESGWAVCPWWSTDEVVGWSRRGEAKRRGDRTGRDWAGLDCRQ